MTGLSLQPALRGVGMTTDMQSPVADSVVSLGAGLSKGNLSVAVVGATGNVGTVMLRVLNERNISIGDIRAFASERSRGRKIDFEGGEQIPVEVLGEGDPEGIDVALFSAGASRALEFAPDFARAGAIVIDNSSAFRMHQDVPLIVPEVNIHALSDHRGIIANPNCSTIQLVAALAPLEAAVGIKRINIVTFQSVSGTGLAAMNELESQTSAIVGKDTIKSADVYPHQIAFNVLPQCDSFEEDGYTKEEHKLVNETRRIMSRPDLRVSATCVRVPVLVGHAEAVHLELDDALDPSEARKILAQAPGIVVVDDPDTSSYPMPIAAEGSDDVYVGRIRRDPSIENGLSMFVVADNLRKGAATNAVQILEALREI